MVGKLSLVIILALATLLALSGHVQASPGTTTRVSVDSAGNEASSTLADAGGACHAWNVVPSPSPAFDQLFGIKAISPSDIWAVGSSEIAPFTLKTLVEHWNGSTWSIVPSPSPGRPTDALFSVDAASSTDVWAVGTFVDPIFRTHGLIEHWDGNSWSVVPTPDLGTSESFLFDVDVVTSDDVWAVGTFAAQTLTLHWDGSNWSVVPSPSVGLSVLDGVAAFASDDVWAVGFANAGQTLIERWDGTSWTIVPSPNHPDSFHQLYEVDGDSPNDVWAVGVTGSGTTFQTLIQHWDGISWSIVPGANLGSPVNILRGVTAVSADNVWAVGLASSSDSPIIQHWDGTSWSMVDSPTEPLNQRSLLDVTSVGSELWAVGNEFSASNRTAHTLIERCIVSITVDIDFKPGGDPNFVKLSSNGDIPVAILTTGTFDATTVDPGSVCFGDAEVPAERDCTESHATGHIDDVDSDGDSDLVLHYETGETGIDPGDNEVCLAGGTFGGIPIQGCDEITTHQ